MFTDTEGEALSTYLITSSNVFHGLTRCVARRLTRCVARRLVHEYPERSGKTCPSSCHANKMAGVDWLHGFLKRRNDLSRAASFNITNVSQFFDKF